MPFTRALCGRPRGVESAACASEPSRSSGASSTSSSASGRRSSVSLIAFSSNGLGRSDPTGAAPAMATAARAFTRRIRRCRRGCWIRAHIGGLGYLPLFLLLRRSTKKIVASVAEVTSYEMMSDASGKPESVVASCRRAPRVDGTQDPADDRPGEEAAEGMSESSMAALTASGSRGRTARRRSRGRESGRGRPSPREPSSS